MEDLMGEAVRLKQAQVDEARKKFIALPIYLQNTFFQTEERVLRNRLPLTKNMERRDAAAFMDDEKVEETLEASRLLLEEGNSFVASGDAVKAMKSYEMAYGMFSYLKPTKDSNWKEKGLTDADIEFHVLVVERDINREQRGRVCAHLARLLCNLAICLRMKGLALDDAAEQALREVLTKYDRTHPKATFLLCKGILSNPQKSTTAGRDECITLLSAVCDNYRNETSEQINEIRLLKASLVEERAKQKEKEKKAFAGKLLEEKADTAPVPLQSSESMEVMEKRLPSEVASDAQPATRESWNEQAVQCRQVIQKLRHSGRDLKADALQEQLDEAAVEKLWKEVMLPMKALDIDGIPTTTPEPVLKKARELHLSLEPPREHTLDSLKKWRTRYIEEEEVKKMRIQDVEIELYAYGAHEGFADGPRSVESEAKLRKKLSQVRGHRHLHCIQHVERCAH